MQDITNLLLAQNAFTAANIKATTAGATVSTLGFEALKFDILVGVLGDTLSGSNSYEFDIQESQDGSTWTAASDSSVQYAVGTANGAANTGAGALLASGAANAAAQIASVGYLGNAPNVRLNVVVKGTMTNGTTISALAQLGHARHQPASMNPQQP